MTTKSPSYNISFRRARDSANRHGNQGRFAAYLVHLLEELGRASAGKETGRVSSIPRSHGWAPAYQWENAEQAEVLVAAEVYELFRIGRRPEDLPLSAHPHHGASPEYAKFGVKWKRTGLSQRECAAKARSRWNEVLKEVTVYWHQPLQRLQQKKTSRMMSTEHSS